MRDTGRLPGLDGLRAIAVVAVLLYHADLLQAGFLGVDVFFVISGFLITTLLLEEWAEYGRIDVARFWLRRARRLLPALFALLLGVLVFAVAFAPDEVARLRGDVAAASLYITNWYLILGQQSYFEAIGRASPLRHLWSLAVEEQFYVLWPLALTASLALLGRRGTLVAVAAAVVGSAVLMAALFDPADPSRVYYGTDTRIFVILAGAGLAFMLRPRARWDLAPPLTGGSSPWGAIVRDGVALAGLAAMVGFFALSDDHDPFLYGGGFLLLALVTAAVIAAVTHPRSIVGRLLDLGPIRWVGERSYSIYLWHWPVFVFSRPGQDLALDPLPVLALRVGLTLALAEASYRFVESPIRHGALGEAWRTWRRAAQDRRWTAYAALVTAVAIVAVPSIALGVDVAHAQPAAPPAYLPVGAIDRVVSQPLGATTGVGAAAGQAGQRGPSSAAPGSSGTSGGPSTSGRAGAPATGGPGGAASSSSPGSPSLGSSPIASPSPIADVVAHPRGRVLAIGDSVLLGAAAELGRHVPDLEVDAAVGRTWAAGIAILRQRAAAGTLPATVIVHLGDNDRLFPRDFDAMMTALRGVPTVVFVDLRVPRPWEQRDDLTLADGVHRYANARLAGWHATSVAHPEYFWDDGYHLRPIGARVYANVIAAALG